jgi:hypothetical protein
MTRPPSVDSAASPPAPGYSQPSPAPMRWGFSPPFRDLQHHRARFVYRRLSRSLPTLEPQLLPVVSIAAATTPTRGPHLLLKPLLKLAALHHFDQRRPSSCTRSHLRLTLAVRLGFTGVAPVPLADPPRCLRPQPLPPMLLILEVLVDISNTDAGGMVVQDCNPGVLRRSFTTAMLPRELYLPQCPFSSLFSLY